MLLGLKGLIKQPGAKPKQIRFDFRALSRCFTTVIRKPLKKRQSPAETYFGLGTHLLSPPLISPGKQYKAIF